MKLNKISNINYAVYNPFSITYQNMSVQLGDLKNSEVLHQYMFQIKRIQHFQGCRAVQVDFSPFLSKTSGAPVKVFPIYNMDMKSYMPSFMIQAGQDQYKEQEKLYAQLHQKKVLEASEQKEQIYVPRPSKKNSCCCICRVIYEDYLTHITNPKHISVLRSSIFNQQIQDLCNSFQSGKRTLPICANDTENINQNPKKRRKCPNKEKKISKPHQQHSFSTTIESSNLEKEIVSVV